MKTFFFIVGLTVGNFAYCWFTGKPYDIAIERSFFQAIAILWYVLGLNLLGGVI